MPSDVSTLWNLVWDMYEKTKGTVWEWIVPAAAGAALIYAAVKFVLIPAGKGAGKVYDYFQKKRFVKRQFYENLSYIEPRDVYQAINRYIPTRFSDTDPSNSDEPEPKYVGVGREQPLLLEQFLKYEYSVKYGQKYYLCLGDCGMGKTTFLLNLYYHTSRLKNYRCVFIPLQVSDYLERIQKIENPASVILMLDAMDENEKALANYKAFITELEKETSDFCRVIITARTNFFENAAGERLGGNKSMASISSKISSARKFYITPFTDEDIQQYLKICYPFQREKQKRAWEILEKNKNLSVRPMLLKHIDSLMKYDTTFGYDFKVYEYLFEKWIERERGSLDTEGGKQFYEECLFIAKAIYYQWMKNGRAGIYLDELENRSELSGLESVKFKGHALLNRTSDGMYKFSHKSYWEYLLAKLALSDVPFSNDLLIGNFDRAVGFLEEMISYREAEIQPKIPGEKILYTKSGRLFTSHEESLGIADYILKYKKPEDAEMIYRETAESEDCSEELRLFAMVKLAQSYWQQVKYRSAGKLLKKIDQIISDQGFKEEWLYIYGTFGNVYAAYSNDFKIKAGQIFLEKLMGWYEDRHMIGYGLLRCYENYCRCCMNYRQKYHCLEQMKKVVEESYPEDQYAEYLLLQAESWKITYDSERLLSILRKTLEKYKQYMDMYEQLLWNCETAKSVYVYHISEGDFFENQDEALEYLYRGYEICRLIYENTEADSCRNPYSLLLWRYTAEELLSLSADKAEEEAKAALDYIRLSENPSEMEYMVLRIKEIFGNSQYRNPEERERMLKEALELAESTYWKVSISWDLWFLYYELGETEKSQAYLKQAYELVTSDSDLYLSRLHSNALRRMLQTYEGDLDKTAVAEKLLKILPEIYGTTKPEKYGRWNKMRAYEALEAFCKEKNPKYLIDIYTGLLECKVTKKTLQALYDACIKFQKESRFQDIVSTTIQGMDSLSKEETDSMEEFLKEYGSRLGIAAETALRSIIKAKQMELRGSRYDMLLTY